MKRNGLIGKYLISMALGSFFGATFMAYKALKALKIEREQSLNNRQMFLMMNDWIKSFHMGKSISKYLSDRNISHVAVYGMGDIGIRLIEEIMATGDIKVDYAVDLNPEIKYSDIVVYAPTDLLPSTQMIIVSPFLFFDEIKEVLKEKVNCDIVSVKEIVEEISF